MAINRSALGLVLALVAGTRLHAQDAHPTGKTATEIFQQSVSGPEHATLKLAEAMPEVNYSFVPTNGRFSGVRSFCATREAHSRR